MNLLLSILAAAIMASQSYATEIKNFIQIHNLKSGQTIGDSGVRFEVIPQSTLTSAMNLDADPAADSIILGYPMDLIGESHMFGGVIVKVSDTKDEALGNLKLSSVLAPVTTELVNTTTQQKLLLKGSYQGTGSETTPSKIIIEIPITQIDNEKKLVYLDLSALGEKLNINSHLAQSGDRSNDNFKHLNSKTVSVDFSLRTLVFDVATEYSVTSINAETKTFTTKNLTLTTRWFLRLNSFVNPLFERRKNTEGVGFFTAGAYTEEGQQNGWISRFDIQDLKNNPVKYYIKGVPSDHREHIAAGFEDWNHKLQPVLGHELLTYEFIDVGDPRYEQIVAGDVRYNVLEWDLVNLAGYGGLGPSLKNSINGQVMAAQTLIQGPKIVELYKGWFKLKEEAAALRSQNNEFLAKELEQNFIRKMFAGFQKARSLKKSEIHFGDLKFEIPAQDPRLHDPTAVNPMDFFETPEGYTYETYMNGYWREIVAHELGHNLGLRHNFRGNLKDTGDGTAGSVSRSVMEYLGRIHRHLNRVSEYDIMAISYGYLGKAPENKDWFCTDEHQAAYSYRNSAECSSADATNDPVSYFENRINRGLDLLLARGSKEASEWTAAQVWGAMNSFVSHLSAYAYSAPTSADKWTNFFGKSGRPESADTVPLYILNKLNRLICGADLDKEVKSKGSQESQQKALENLTAYRTSAFKLLKSVPAPWPIVNKDNFSCL